MNQPLVVHVVHIVRVLDEEKRRVLTYYMCTVRHCNKKITHIVVKIFVTKIS